MTVTVRELATDRAPRHREPCGCVYRQIDAPDDLFIGQSWQQIGWCGRPHRPTEHDIERDNFSD